MNKKKLFTGHWPIVAVAPALILFILFSIIPAIANIAISFTDYNGNPFGKISFVGSKNYINAVAVNADTFFYSVKNTLIFSFGVTLLQNGFAVILAVMVNMKLAFRNFYRSVLFLPSLLSVVVIGLTWSLIFDPYSGPLNKLLGLFGIESAFLGDVNLAMPILIFVMLWTYTGYAMVIYLAGLQGVPLELYESADLDGAGKLQTLRYITLPMIRPAITINMLLSLIGTLKQFDMIVVLTNGGPVRATTTLSFYMFQSLTTSYQGEAAALSIVLFLMVLVVVSVYLHYSRKTEVEL